MAVSYTSNIYTQDRLFFIKLLFRWSGSVWQMLWVDFLVFIVVYIALALVYQNIIFEYPQAKQTFELTVKWIGLIRTSVPLSFMLGFFVSSVLGRWWSTCMSIPWLHSPSFYCQAIVDTSRKAHSDIARKIRITVLRYLNLSWILMMAEISSQVQSRFGFWKLERRKFKLTWQKRLEMINHDSKVKKYFGQLITETEMQAFARSAELSNDNDTSYSPEYWLPLVWGTRLLRRAKNIGCISDERQLLYMHEVLANFRINLGTVWTYSEFNIPLVYTQVAVAAVYIFLLATVVSTQLTESEFASLLNQASPFSTGATAGNRTALPQGAQVIAYLPIIGSLEFIFYLGWFKIGVSMLNCLGKDEADLPLSDILNYNLKASVKLGGAEDTIFPNGLTDNNEPEEQQIAEFLGSFDFNEVHAHDKFVSSEDTEQELTKALIKRLQKKSGLKLPAPQKPAAPSSMLDFLNLDSSDKKAGRKAEATRKQQLMRLALPVSRQLSRVPSGQSLASMSVVSSEDKYTARRLSRTGSFPGLVVVSPPGADDKRAASDKAASVSSCSTQL